MLRIHPLVNTLYLDILIRHLRDKLVGVSKVIKQYKSDREAICRTRITACYILVSINGNKHIIYCSK